MARNRTLLIVLCVLGLIAGACGRSDDNESTATTAASGGSEECSKEPLEATDVGITADTITIEVMADVGSPLAPGLFQGNVDAINAFVEHTNANGGLACRKLAAKTWDSKLSADE